MIVDPDGPACHCGSRGCVEQLAGQEALLRRAGCASVGDLARRAGQGDAAALASLQRAGAALGVALVSTVNVLDIPVIVLGGIYSRLAEWISPPISAEVNRRAVSASWAPVSVVISNLGDDAAVRGAAGTVVHAVVERAVRPSAMAVVT